MDKNFVALEGTVCGQRPPMTRSTSNGAQVTNFSMETVETTKNGKPFKTFHDIVAWNEQSDIACKLANGMRVGVEGSLITESYDKQDGSKVYLKKIRARMVTVLGQNTQPMQQQTAQQTQGYSQPAQRGYAQSAPQQQYAQPAPQQGYQQRPQPQRQPYRPQNGYQGTQQRQGGYAQPPQENPNDQDVPF